ncbi:hypothetical protein BWI93_21790 [Siphonobacter sp. BAB-5385]|uniref:FecR family protein n=1 Tax=Siphonobacter sp. BAB-5385 TaxID=1864822 RepID=UPI000B9E675C|nr:FecR family protein [Siphonobacter sp. BAB-5385]OZI06140.1 hypothetical protein BWI93_21790 [Siphonobacter sp. BAB-5385]
MNYQDFKREDFVADSYFRKWVQNPDAATRQFWYEFLTDYPEQTETIRQAAELVLDLAELSKEKVPDPNTAEQEQAWLEITRRTHPSYVRKLPLYRQRWAWATAACLAFLLSWGFWYSYRSSSQPYQSLRSTSEVPLKEWVNTTDHAQTLTLQDGSSIILNPGSRLSYPVQFAADKREVYLSGEALFEVAKNPKQPFFVYANELIAKVLGTSFKVRAFPKDQQVIVTVRTGRVSVFAQSDAHVKEKASSRELEGLVLSPNQQITYSRQDVRMTKSLVTEPVVLSHAKPSIPPFTFRNTSVKTVFEAVEKAYGVQVVFDEETLRNCQLTADLTDEPLFRKLEIICKSIEAQYQVLDAQIVITGHGCPANP